jgi:phosphopantothenoylcysteine synthetase/decarboxylase
MNCIVTAGPTCEPLDEVRRLTNFSTGRLGGELAGFLTSRGHSVTLLLGAQSTWPGPPQAARVELFTTTADLRGWLQALGSANVQAVFHAAAVSDFRFNRAWHYAPDGTLTEVQSAKFSSRAGPLLIELQPTEKIIVGLRDWFPRACLVGWKYELEGDRAAALAAAQRQILESRTSACVVNGRAYGEGFGLLTADGRCVHLATRTALFDALEALARNFWSLGQVSRPQ